MMKAIILLSMLTAALTLGCADTEKRDEETALRVSATVAAMAPAGSTHTPDPTPDPDQPLAPDGEATIADDQPSAETGPIVTNPSPYDPGPSPAYDGPTGIRVSGTGAVTGVPDVAVITLGVEVLEDTASEARARAAQAMNGVMTALTKAGVSPEDIRTSNFNISPRHQGVEVQWCEDDEKSAGIASPGALLSGCYSSWENRLTGYTASNRATVKVRKVQEAGAVIDRVTETAGDLVRIHGVRFDIDDPTPLQDEAMTEAVADMRRKAELLAEESGVALGRLVYITEDSSSPQKIQPVYALEGMAMAAPDAPTPISGGRMEFTASVQGVYLIEYEQ